MVHLENISASIILKFNLTCPKGILIFKFLDHLQKEAKFDWLIFENWIFTFHTDPHDFYDLVLSKYVRFLFL